MRKYNISLKIISLIIFCTFNLYAGPFDELPIGDGKGLGELFGNDNKADKEGKNSLDNSKKDKTNKKPNPMELIKLATQEDTLEDELAAGTLYSSKLLGAVKLDADKNKQSYVNKIGRHIANQSERKDLPWTFAVVNTDSVNAFAAPGGYIFITSGLFNVLDTEDELAAVLSHEISHVLKKHQFKVIKEQKMVQFATESFSSMSNDAMIGKMSGMIGQIMAKGLDQSAEFEADKDGLVLCTRSGYDASAILSVLDKLNALNKRNDSAMAFMTATHPTPIERQMRLANYSTDEIVNYSILSKNNVRINSFKK